MLQLQSPRVLDTIKILPLKTYKTFLLAYTLSESTEHKNQNLVHENHPSLFHVLSYQKHSRSHHCNSPEHMETVTIFTETTNPSHKLVKGLYHKQTHQVRKFSQQKTKQPSKGTTC